MYSIGFNMHAENVSEYFIYGYTGYELIMRFYMSVAIYAYVCRGLSGSHGYLYILLQ